ncbi:MAG TPA: CAP domain-containing protein [Blastocatellia bacterium]|nr:CAP domain-containing protein [Blastocatellia bacterium]
MERKFGVLFSVVALLVAMTPFGSSRAYSEQKGSGVAGGARVARGKNGSVHPSSPRYSPGSATDPDEAAAPGVAGRGPREIESLEQQCLDEVNDIRRLRRLVPLSFNEDLLPLAREYSRRMAEEHFFSHTDPEGRSVRERVEQAEIKWRLVGENLAYSKGYINPVAASLRSWMESPGHRRNILDPDFQLTAVGAWVAADGTVYLTEIFLKQ